MLAVLALALLLPGVGWSQCYGSNDVCYGHSSVPIRVNGNEVQTYGSSWMTGVDTWAWTPYVTDYGYFNGSAYTQGATGSANPGDTAWAKWTIGLQSPGPGPGSYASEDYVHEPGLFVLAVRQRMDGHPGQPTRDPAARNA